jgi:prepilin-type N-terminal cleavage/methylation domain-containing protein
VLTQKSSVKKAFTLTELLVSMAVLGLIATLTLPHMFMSVDRAKKRAAFKEAYQALAQATHAAMMEGVVDTTKIIPYFNAKKVCMVNSRSEGCSQIPDDVTGHWQAGEAGVVLPSGVTIFGFNTGLSEQDTVVIGLEDFPKQEFFRITLSVKDSGAFKGDAASGDLLESVWVRPGEIKCLEQKCVDMFKKD